MTVLKIVCDVDNVCNYVYIYIYTCICVHHVFEIVIYFYVYNILIKLRSNSLFLKKKILNFIFFSEDTSTSSQSQATCFVYRKPSLDTSGGSGAPHSTTPRAGVGLVHKSVFSAVPYTSVLAKLSMAALDNNATHRFSQARVAEPRNTTGACWALAVASSSRNS